MSSVIKRMVRGCLSKAGYDIVRLCPGGPGQSLAPVWSEPFTDLIRLAGSSSARTIFDVGANVGQTATRLAGMFPQSVIYSFEPYPEAFGKLRSVAERLRNVRPFNLALGERDGEATLFLNQDSATNSLLRNSDSMKRFADYSAGVNPAGAATVALRRLDTFCGQHDIRSIDVLKLDTQGYELKVLKGAGRLFEERRIRFICLEVLFVPIYEQQADFPEVHRELSDHGYRFVGLYGVARDDAGFLKWGDALYMAEQSTDPRAHHVNGGIA